MGEICNGDGSVVAPLRCDNGGDCGNGDCSGDVGDDGGSSGGGKAAGRAGTKVWEVVSQSDILLTPPRDGSRTMEAFL